jgi:hypothetical protein
MFILLQLRSIFALRQYMEDQVCFSVKLNNCVEYYIIGCNIYDAIWLAPDQVIFDAVRERRTKWTHGCFDEDT